MSKKQIMSKINTKNKPTKAMNLNQLFYTPLEELLKLPNQELREKKYHALLLAKCLSGVITMKTDKEAKL